MGKGGEGWGRGWVGGGGGGGGRGGWGCLTPIGEWDSMKNT